MHNITRHPTTSNRSNPMRWKCSPEHCFNRLKRPKIEVFAECFPGNIQMSDVDGEVEIKGHWLRLEWKAQGAPLPLGQEINYKELTKTTQTVVFIVYGDPENMTVSAFDIAWQGKMMIKQGASLDDLKARFVQWAIWADGPF